MKISTLWQMFNPANHLLRTMLYGKEKKTIYKKMDCKRENVSRTQVCKLKICTLVIRSLHSRKIPRFL
ncbi:uncharacterized protein LOC143252695 isoform X2 [Tachypleus tridentatus]|uniref:uncharacterized protein LOC143252695 isoform X2 n=1 Tax=Tachypleus tridentatus TaxID=6853 RepID=UPI003FD0FDA0